jgi:hypothetical protein
MALLFYPFISMLIPRAHELTIVSEEEEEQWSKGKKMNQGKSAQTREEKPPTSPKSTLMQPFVCMLIPRAHKFSKNEAPKDERVRRVYNEFIRTIESVNPQTNQRWFI